LFALGIALFSGNLFALLLFSFHFFLFKRKDLIPGFKYISRKSSSHLLTLGGKFFIIQVAGVIEYGTTNILISRYFSPRLVTEYNVSYKFFSILSMVFAILISPVWSAVTDAQTKGEYSWIKSVGKKLLITWYGLVLCSLIFLGLSSYVYRVWLHGSVVIPFSISFGVMLFILSTTFSMIYVNILNGLSHLKTQYYLSVISMVYFIPLSYLLAVKLNWGVLGICIALVLANVNGIIAAPIEYYKIIGRNNSK
jgi:O-antigen/teichoic acid export membrane protein